MVAAVLALTDDDLLMRHFADKYHGQHGLDAEPLDKVIVYRGHAVSRAKAHAEAVRKQFGDRAASKALRDAYTLRGSSEVPSADEARAAMERTQRAALNKDKAKIEEEIISHFEVTSKKPKL